MNKRLVELKSLVEGAEISLQQARRILDSLSGAQEVKETVTQSQVKGTITQSGEGQIIEGFFDGQNMIGPDGKRYSVPANYASKSKMIEGDGLKLTITADGSFVYKQIDPLERDRLTGKLAIDEETGDYRVLINGKSYKVLTASITYFKGEVGDSVAILVPKGRESSWAAVENIFRISEAEQDAKESVDLSKKSTGKDLSAEDSLEELKQPAEKASQDDFLVEEKRNEFLLPENEIKAGPATDYQSAEQAHGKAAPNGFLHGDASTIIIDRTRNVFGADPSGAARQDTLAAGQTSPKSDILNHSNDNQRLEEL
ncbi:hypothetical protein AUJ29_02445 [Candidatus Kuenenbacteria bacterium CG1_02_38_13]|uniref:50S ribosomal protein L7/L12 n=1 Tax=Candidatus Kuenenbacteria bacterium CG1_02_38_13 TaxID=1805235 RepID=A0A1J4U359_9BACT|nr:MAG: hypothetical protein AUJ29_02445 [Candidatus Kuenenbacteria bacterium CG1_02_38_13]